jgi:peptidoglycan/xylan/chitin deacetylase (PgdA/CDA1 family)
VNGILTYHSIDDSGSVLSVHPDVFRRQADWLASGPVRVLPLGEIRRAPRAGQALALTFDDGFENFASMAWPVLRERELPATLFVVTDRVGKTNDWKSMDLPQLPLLDWEELGRLSEEGVALGSHTRTHPDLTRLEASRLEDEIAGSAERIKRETGVRPVSFAYPFGRHDDAATEAVRRAFEWACTTEFRPVDRSDCPHLLPRLDVYYFRQPGRLERWGSGGFRRRVALRHLGRRLRDARA